MHMNSIPIVYGPCKVFAHIYVAAYGVVYGPVYGVVSPVKIVGWQSAGTWLDRRNAGWDQVGCGWGKYRQLGRQSPAFCQLTPAFASELVDRLLPATYQRYTYVGDIFKKNKRYLGI